MRFLRSVLPVRKVTASTAGAFIGQIICYVIVHRWPEFGLTPDQEMYITAACVFAVGWLVPASKGRHANIPKQRVNEDQGVSEPRALPVGLPD